MSKSAIYNPYVYGMTKGLCLLTFKVIFLVMSILLWVGTTSKYGIIIKNES